MYSFCVLMSKFYVLTEVLLFVNMYVVNICKGVGATLFSALAYTMLGCCAQCWYEGCFPTKIFSFIYFFFSSSSDRRVGLGSLGMSGLYR